MKHLFKSIKLFNKELSNRIVLSPLTRGRNGEERKPNNLHVDYYAQRASAGLIITECSAVSPSGYGWVGAPGIYTDEMVEAWKAVVDAVHEKNSVIVHQLWHVGRAGHSDFLNGNAMKAPSAIAINGEGVHTYQGKKNHETPDEMTLDEVNQVIKDFGQGAINAQKAGFDGVELHAANGYLPDQFLNPNSNHRTDKYGGSVENRCRFILEVIDEMIYHWSNTRIGVKISPNGIYNDMGHEDFRATYFYLIKELNKRSIAYLHVQDGLAFGFHGKGEPVTLKEIRPLFDGLIIGNCGYTGELANQRIGEGLADMISFGRPFITNPDLPERLKNGWELNSFDDPSHWYTPDAEGYTTYEPYKVS